MKKNNKGFSLVELIVVVLIMGIIAVALAPQVMKWVGKAQDNSRTSEIASVKSSVQVAVAEAQSDGWATSAVTFRYNASGVEALSSATNGALYDAITEVSGGDYGTYGLNVSISDTGAVTVN